MWVKWVSGPVLAACLAGVGGYGLAQSGGQQEKKVNSSPTVYRFDQVKEEPYAFGWIRWLMSRGLDSQAEQTFGVVEIRAHHSNALHVHPNCEELLYVLSGSCEHIVGESKVTLHPGDLLRVPRGVKHQAIVTGDEALRAIISYSSPDRQVVNLGEAKE